METQAQSPWSTAQTSRLLSFQRGTETILLTDRACS